MGKPGTLPYSAPRLVYADPSSAMGFICSARSSAARDFFARAEGTETAFDTGIRAQDDVLPDQRFRPVGELRGQLLSLRRQCFEGALPRCCIAGCVVGFGPAALQSCQLHIELIGRSLREASPAPHQ